MRKKQSGISLINIILFLGIVICIIILSWILNNNEQIEDSYKHSSDAANIKSNVIENKSIDKAEVNVNETKVTLNNSILAESGNIEIDNVGKKYYYKQLTDIGKSMYNDIEENIYKFVDGYASMELEVKNSEASRNFQAVWDAISLDRPDLFWIDTQKISLVTTTTTFFGNTKYKYTIEPKEGGSYFVDYFETSSDVRVSRLLVDKIADNILQDATGSTKDKIKHIHDELVDRISYNQERDVNNSNIYGALIQKKCVCEGYAEAFKYILDKIDIPCVVIYGTGIDSKGDTEAHAWNYVKMDDDKWYAVDVTWDDPIIIGNGKLTDRSRYRYFLKGSDNFSATHIENGDVSNTGQSFKYPELSKTDY